MVVFLALAGCGPEDSAPDDHGIGGSLGMAAGGSVGTAGTNQGGRNGAPGGTAGANGGSTGGNGSSLAGMNSGAGGPARGTGGAPFGDGGGPADGGVGGNGGFAGDGASPNGGDFSMTGGRGGGGSGGGSSGGPSGGFSGTGGTSGGVVGNAGRGGMGGTATGTGGIGGSGNAGCSVAPVDPNATIQAKNLLCYLYSIYGKNVLSGQQETSWSSPENDISWYDTNVGKYPAVLGGDYLYPSGTSSRAIAYWNAGGIPMIRYHMGAPPNADTYEDSKGSANIANVLASGTTENQSFRSKLDYVATELKKLSDANVPVLWAPLHEYQPNGWFWWSKGSATQFVQLWRYMFDYLVTTKGLHNLVWLAPSSGSPDAAWYPGKAYVDVAGPDTYATNPPFTAMFTSAKNIIGTTVPITLHETGVVPQPSTMFPTAAPWVLWNIWAGYQISENTVANVKSAYESPYTITRDEVPNLK
jgi:hypothetical protein